MNLKKHLQTTDTSIKAFAEQIGVSEMAVRHWLSGNRIPRPTVMKRIAEATNGAVQPNDLFGLESSLPNPRQFRIDNRRMKN